MISEIPSTSRAVYIFAHGAGAGMEHPFMSHIASLFIKLNIGVIRFNFPYLEKGRKTPGSPREAIEKITTVYEEIASKTDLPIFAGGKSYGGRMSSTAATEGLLEHVKGLIFFGFPLHPPGKPSLKRAEHLKAIDKPMLFLQGDKDKLAEPELIKEVTNTLHNSTLHLYNDADHSFKVSKRAAISQQEMYDLLVKNAVQWIDKQL